MTPGFAASKSAARVVKVFVNDEAASTVIVPVRGAAAFVAVAVGVRDAAGVADEQPVRARAADAATTVSAMSVSFTLEPFRGVRSRRRSP